MSFSDTSCISEISRYVVYMPVDDTSSCIPFKISDDADVEDLATLIRAHPEFKEHLKGERPFLFQYGEPCGTDENSYQRVTQWLHTKSASDKMKPRYRLEKYFPEGPAPEAEDVIDIVVATHALLETRDVLCPISDRHCIDGISKRKALLIKKMAKYPDPLLGIQSGEQIRTWLNEDGVHYHRPAFNYGPSTALFHPVIAKLWYRLKHLDLVQNLPIPSDDSSLRIAEPPAEYLEWVQILIKRSCDACSTDVRLASSLKDCIDHLIGERGSQWKHSLEENTATPDVMWMSGNIVCAIMEFKNIDGVCGSALLQCLLVYTKVLTQPHYANYMKSSNLPIILIGIMGTRLEISTAIFTDGVYADKLLSEDFIVDAGLPDTILRLGYIFTAISLALEELRSIPLQTKAGQEPSLAHTFPAPLPDPRHVGSIPTLRYIGKLTHLGTLLDERDTKMVRLERPHALYLAKMDCGGQEVDVVVKFTIRYQEKAHRILAERDYAPRLHYCIPVIGDMHMVIMDYIKGDILSSLVGDACKKDKVKSTINYLESALKLLHEHNLVYGDLRPHNVFWKACGGLMLINFDWSGVHQVDRYPTTWKCESDRAPGMAKRAKMDKAHDLFMLDRLRNLFK